MPDAIVVKHTVTKAKHRSSVKRPRVTTARRVVHAAKTSSVSDAIAVKHTVVKAKHHPSVKRPRVVTARRVAHVAKILSTTDATAVKRPIVKAKHRLASQQPRVATACVMAPSLGVSSAPDTVADKPQVPKQQFRLAAEQRRGAIAHRVAPMPETSSTLDAIAVKDPVLKAKRRPAAERPRVVIARRMVPVLESSSALDTITIREPVSKGKPRSAVGPPRVAMARRVVPVSDASPATDPIDIKNSVAKATPHPAAGHPRVAIAHRWVNVPETSPATDTIAVRNPVSEATPRPVVVQSQVAFHDYSTVDHLAVVGDREREHPNRALGGPSASDAFAAAAADAGPQQTMMPPSASAPVIEPSVTSLHSFRYVPGQKTVDDVPRPAAQQKLIQLNQDGNYAALAKQGGALLQKEKVDDQLKFMIANAMAWTGRLHAAETLYNSLQNGPMALDSKVALANIQRWRGKDYLAVPMYRGVLAVDPRNEEATHGLQLSEDAMRPRTRLSVNRTHDSDNVNTRLVTLQHDWQTDEGLRTWGVQVNQMSDWQKVVQAVPQPAPTIAVPNPAAVPPIVFQRNASQATVVVRHQEFDKPLQPAVELELGDRLYGRITITPSPSLPVQVTVGKVNWGQMSLNPLALERRLSAVNVGVRGSFNLPVGTLSVAADNYTVSDNNNVQTGTLRFSPAIRLPLHLQPVLGLEYRKADFNTASYWSPAVGYGLGYVGLEGQWSGRNDRWTVSASVQRGWGFYGEAQRSWGGTLSGRYVINRDWSIGASVWSIVNSRESRPYRARSGIVFLERKW